MRAQGTGAGRVPTAPLARPCGRWRAPASWSGSAHWPLWPLWARWPRWTRWARCWPLAAALAWWGLPGWAQKSDYAEPAAAAAVPADWPSPPFAPPVMARYPDPSPRPDSPALRSGRPTDTSPQELSAWLAETVAQAPAGTRITALAVGRSQQGAAIEGLRFSRGAGRPWVLLVGQQHGDEPAGAEALLALARELSQPALGAVLDKLDVVLVPRANPDGAAWGRRVLANGVDLNRDHLLLRTPEAQALAALVRERRPLLVVDSHEFSVGGRYLRKFGAVQRYDLLFQHATVANLPDELSRASLQWFREPIVQALGQAGLTSEWYYTNPTTPGDLSLSMGGVQPDTGRNVHGLRHSVSLLLESRGIGLGPYHLARRVHSHLVALRTALRQAARHADALVALQARADAQVAAQACKGEVTLLAAPTRTRRELLMLEPLTGADKPLELDWDSALALRPLQVRTRPCGYWLAADQQRAAAVLAALGVQVQRFTAPTALRTEAYEEQARGEADRADARGQVDDGEQRMLKWVVALRPEAMEAPVGSLWVPLDQPLAHLAVAALEPDTQNSLAAHRLVDRLDAVRRVVARPQGVARAVAAEPAPAASR